MVKLLKRLWWFWLLIVGFGMGVALAWGPLAPQPGTQAPSALRAEIRRDMLFLIADAYAYEHDLRKARERFAALDVPNPTPLFTLLVDEARREGREDEARRLAQLAVALEYDTPALRALAHVATSSPPSTPSPTATPVPLASPSPVPALSPTPQTQQGRYEWVVVERRPLTCAEQPGDVPLLVVYVEDADGTPMSGVPLLAQSENDTQRFFTGLKADNPGYADLEVRGQRYTVRVDRGQSEVALDLTMPLEGAKCSTVSPEDATTTRRGWVVRFRQVVPAP
nr:hypothetical protein [Ardenticatena sp.]